MLVINKLMSDDFKTAVGMLKKEFSENQYEAVENFINKQFKTDNIAYTSTSAFAAFWYAGNHEKDFKKELYIIKGYATSAPQHLVGIALTHSNELIAYYQDREENDYFYYVELTENVKKVVVL